MSAEQFCQLYAFLGDRTSDPNGDEWDHEALRRLVQDIADGPLAEAAS